MNLEVILYTILISPVMSPHMHFSRSLFFDFCEIARLIITDKLCVDILIYAVFQKQVLYLQYRKKVI